MDFFWTGFFAVDFFCGVFMSSGPFLLVVQQYRPFSQTLIVGLIWRSETAPALRGEVQT
jgi:hypothetical protein